VTDHDDWAKEDCACGHRRHAHDKGSGRCRHTRTRRVAPPDLPPPILGDSEFDPFAAPLNWPPYEEWPMVEVPCCSAFQDAGEALAEAGLS